MTQPQPEATCRRRIQPRRLGLAEELGVMLYLLSSVTDPNAVAPLKSEAVDVLSPFEAAGALTPDGSAVLAWARQP